jgi:large subunit ribosomal protein L5
MAQKATPTQSTSTITPGAKARMQVMYESEVVPALVKRFSFTNPMRVPRLSKIVINMGTGDALQNIKLLDAAVKDLSMITGQRPSIRRSTKSISNFKLRIGVPIGCAVTLRSTRMWEFYDRLLTVAVPRVRDFRGFSPKSFDGRGNYTVGLKEHIVFPEIDYDKVEKVRGMDISFVTTAPNDEEGRELLRLLKWPFRER